MSLSGNPCHELITPKCAHLWHHDVIQYYNDTLMIHQNARMTPNDIWMMNYSYKSFPSVSNRNNFGHLGTQYPFSDSMTPKTPYDVNLRSNDAMWHPLTLEWCQILVNDARVTFHTPNDTSLYPNYCYKKVIPLLCTQCEKKMCFRTFLHLPSDTMTAAWRQNCVQWRQSNVQWRQRLKNCHCSFVYMMRPKVPPMNLPCNHPNEYFWRKLF